MSACALGVRPSLLLMPQREPLETVSQGQELIAAARVEPAGSCDAPELFGNALKIRCPLFW